MFFQLMDLVHQSSSPPPLRDSKYQHLIKVKDRVKSSENIHKRYRQLYKQIYLVCVLVKKNKLLINLPCNSSFGPLLSINQCTVQLSSGKQSDRVTLPTWSTR